MLSAPRYLVRGCRCRHNDLRTLSTIAMLRPCGCSMFEKSKYKLVDLFSGCGGISRGFEWTGRFGTQLGIELMPHPAAAFLSNICDIQGRPTRTLQADVEAITRSASTIWAELKQCDIAGPGEIDVLVGGPPCQGFSRNGVRKYDAEDKQTRFYDDPRNHLYRAFLRFAAETQPKIILIENVREFLNFNNGKFSSDLVSKLNDIGYDVDFKKICAADYGVPQIRWRVLFVAVRKDVCDTLGQGPKFPTPEFKADRQLTLLGGNRQHRTVFDAISDLPPAPVGKKNYVVHYDTTSDVSEYASLMRNPLGHVFNHFARKLSAKQIARINAVGSGRMKNISEELRTEKFYGSAYRRLSWDEPALTITTWVYHVGSGRFAHPEEDRGITMREAARLQSFDDGFAFPPMINPVSQMIGNAVPPLLAYEFAKLFESTLDAYYAQTNQRGKMVA